jgi:glycosyltransferase involved in cell wall biosynthesis
MTRASVIIPAHNETTTIARTLRGLRHGLSVDQLDVIVVCNGCTDDTAEVARRADPAARVIEIAEPSKVAAVREGNAATDVFPRIHLDADIELAGESVDALLEPLLSGSALATAPQRRVPRTGCSRLVSAYYDVWEELPHVRAGLFGRGVVAVTEEAQARISALPRLMSDDLGMSDSFTDDEREVVDAAVALVHPPRTITDLPRRRIRIVTGNVQAGQVGVRRESSRTTPRTLFAMVLARPSLALRMPVFVVVHVAATLGARRAVRQGDFTTWRRDESSRTETR